MLKLTWQIVVLVLGVLAMLLGACIWLVVIGVLPGATLALPFAAGLAWGAAWLGQKAAYLKGKSELPDALLDPELTDSEVATVVKTMRPPSAPPAEVTLPSPVSVPKAGKTLITADEFSTYTRTNRPPRP